MSTTAFSSNTRSRVTSTLPPNVAGSLPPPHGLTSAQMRELEAELRRELGALDRRLVSEQQHQASEMHLVDVHDAAAAIHRTNDAVVRRDVVATALARIASGEYGACSLCGAPIPYGRLFVMPESTHCLGCGGRA